MVKPKDGQKLETLGLVDMPDELYRSKLDWVSHSELSEFKKSPSHYAMAYLSGKKARKSAALELGTAVHSAILEPEKFEEETGFIDQKLLNKILAMRDSVFSTRSARELLSKECLYEKAAFWTDPDTGVKCKGKIDCVSPQGFVLDLKTTSSIAEFQDSLKKFQYYRQAAFYLDAVESLSGLEMHTFYIIAVESSPPYLCQPFELEPLSIDEGRLEYKDLLENFAACKKANHWPGLADRILPIGLKEEDLKRVARALAAQEKEGRLH